MFDISVTKTVIEHSQEQTKKYNFGRRYTANGTSEQQLTGIIGQSAILQLFELPMVDGALGFDHGIDFEYCGLTIDVKTMGRTTPVRRGYVNNFLALQMHFKTDIYLFCSFNKTNFILSICGWCTKLEFQRNAKFFAKGSERKRSDGTSFKTFSDLYEIDNSQLNDVKDLLDLKKQLEDYSKLER